MKLARGGMILAVAILLTSSVWFLGSAHAQVPGTLDIIQEFPDFAKEEADEREDSLDFEHSRVVAFSFHGGYDLVQGGLTQTMSNGGSLDIALNYFMYTQSAIVVRAGTSFSSLDVAGIETYAGVDTRQKYEQLLRYTGSVTMYRFSMGYRYYFGHPAYPNVLSFLGLNIQLDGGVLLRAERYTILQNGPEHPGLLNFSDASPIVVASLGLEFPFATDDLYLGFRGGYQLSLLSDEGDVGYVREPRDGDWVTFTSYLMLHLE